MWLPNQIAPTALRIARPSSTRKKLRVRLALANDKDTVEPQNGPRAIDAAGVPNAMTSECSNGKVESQTPVAVRKALHFMR